ncbi:MAG: Sjogren's syndrome/scleroderma autoantigen 1 family protein [Halobacteriaceae archaeon]
MSDFDKEAERERLREKYEGDKEKREATQQMSELLLQGATMTNKHCDTCSSPIFRHQGQEFCPNCQEVVGSPQNQQTEQTEQTTQSETPSAQGENDSNESMDTQTATTTAQPEQTAQPPQHTTNKSGDHENPKAVLLRTITSLANQAEQTTDPAQAKSYLAAAKEAAETLSVLESGKKG